MIDLVAVSHQRSAARRPSLVGALWPLAKEVARVEGEDGAIGQTETRIGDSVVMTFDAKDACTRDVGASLRHTGPGSLA